jgi:hypothetical protein
MLTDIPQIAEPAAILAFQPGDVPSAANSAIVPGEFESRSVMVSTFLFRCC